MDLVYSPDYGSTSVFEPFDLHSHVSVKIVEGRPSCVQSRPAPSPIKLPAVEQTVVAMANFDHRASVEPSGRLARIMRRIFGDNPSNRMADDRLEALRRYAVLFRLDGPCIATDEYSRFEAAGFSPAAGAEVRRLVTLGSIAAK